MPHTSGISLHHVSRHRPEPNILLFRRPLGTDGTTGAVNPELARMQREHFRKQFGLEWSGLFQSRKACVPSSISIGVGCGGTERQKRVVQKKKSWMRRASIPLPIPCEGITLPFELHTHFCFFHSTTAFQPQHSRESACRQNEKRGTQYCLHRALCSLLVRVGEWSACDVQVRFRPFAGKSLHPDAEQVCPHRVPLRTCVGRLSSH